MSSNDSPVVKETSIEEENEAKQELEVLRVGGVPEHFNEPWKDAETIGNLERQGVCVDWTDFPGGTGDMCKALDAGQVDVAIVLTEGAAVFAASHPDIALCGVYVNSPLIWGVHVGAESPFTCLEDLKGKCTFAISRFGSGSHLMAYVFASQLGWDMSSDVQFKVVGNLAGAKEALCEDGTLVFLWEKFTTAPLVKSGLFRRVGECPTPWPCFSIAAKRSLLQRMAPDGRASLLSTVLGTVRQTCKRFKASRENSVTSFTEIYGLAREDIEVWFETVEWACNEQVSETMLQGVIDTLQELGRFGEGNAAPAVRDLCACEVIA